MIYTVSSTLTFLKLQVVGVLKIYFSLILNVLGKMARNMAHEVIALFLLLLPNDAPHARH